MIHYNWTAAFVAFCNNHSLKQISEAFGIPLDPLQNKASSDRWEALRAELPLAGSEKMPVRVTVPQSLAVQDPFEIHTRADVEKAASMPATVQQQLPVTIQVRLTQLANNRKANYEDAARLRDHARDLVEALASGNLKMEQLFHNKGTVIRTDRSVTPADLVNIATYLRTIHDMTYRALGDGVAMDKGAGEAPGGDNNFKQAPQITIILPAAIAQPRANRKLLDEARAAGAKIIDVKSTSVPAQELPADSGEQAPSE